MRIITSDRDRNVGSFTRKSSFCETDEEFVKEMKKRAMMGDSDNTPFIKIEGEEDSYYSFIGEWVAGYHATPVPELNILEEL